MSVGHDTPDGPALHVHRQGSGYTKGRPSSLSDKHGTPSHKQVNPPHRRSKHASSLLRPDSCIIEDGPGALGFRQVQWLAPANVLLMPLMWPDPNSATDIS